MSATLTLSSFSPALVPVSRRSGSHLMVLTSRSSRHRFVACLWALRYASPKPSHSRCGLTQVLAPAFLIWRKGLRRCVLAKAKLFGQFSPALAHRLPRAIDSALALGCKGLGAALPGSLLLNLLRVTVVRRCQTTLPCDRYRNASNFDIHGFPPALAPASCRSGLHLVVLTSRSSRHRFVAWLWALRYASPRPCHSRCGLTQVLDCASGPLARR